MLENFQGDSWGLIPPLRMPSLLPHDLCHGQNSSRWLPAVMEFQLSYSRSWKMMLWKVLHSICNMPAPGRTLHSNGCVFPFLLCLLLLFFSQLFVRPRQTTILPFCFSFSWGSSWSLPSVQCHKPLSIVLQALCLSDLIPWINLSLPLYNHKGFDLGHTWMVLGFSLLSSISVWIWQ